MIDEKYERRVAHLQQALNQFRILSGYEVARRCGINPQRVTVSFLSSPDELEFDLTKCTLSERQAFGIMFFACLTAPKRLRFALALKEPTR